MNKRSCIVNLLKCVLMAITFFVIDFALRYFTRWLGYYSIFELAPSLFTVCWSAIFIVLLSLFSRRIGRIAYAVLYSVWSIYALIQYVYYLIFDKFFFLSDIRNASEGGNYLSYVLDLINADFFVMLFLYLALGIVGFFMFPDFRMTGNKLVRSILRCILLACSCIGIVLIPSLYTENKQALFFSSKYEYEQFSNSAFDLEIAGVYQFVMRDAWKTYFEPKKDPTEQYIQAETYLNNKSSKGGNNALTGILEGKNLLLIQMESIDDWVLTEETMPTVYRLMQEGINFSNMYTCLYGSGWTFSTEFAFNSGIYQSTKGIAAYSMSQSAFPYSIANMLKNKGYHCKSFHQNTGNFYSRSSIHPALGYEQYVSTSSIVSSDYLTDSDISMVADDNCWALMTTSAPFLTFINTYGAHVPYSADDPLVQWALSEYPEYNVENRDFELNVVYAKARTLDDMFAKLLERLEEEGLLDNTVIIAYADHYCYGLSDKELVHELTKANGTSIMERTPAFIWYEGCESIEVDKVCQTVDWVPTIANLYGMDVTPYVMGSDIFDESYAGYAIFPDGTWLTNEAYAVNGLIQWNNGMTDKEISEMNSYVQVFYAANEAILASDYYAQFEE